MSASSKKSPDSAELTSPLVIVGRLLLIAAIGISGYLGVTSLVNGTVAGCEEGGACDEVLASKWAYFFGVPVSLIGLGTYAAFLVADWRRCCDWFCQLCGVVILGGAAYFVILQAFVVKAFCPWCCVTHFLAVTGVLLIGFARSKQLIAAGWVPAGLALAGLAVFAAGQALGPDVKTTEGASLGDAGAKVSPALAEEREISLHNGKFKIDVKAYPSIGNSLTAEHVGVGLFDWTCPHCQELTEVFTEVQMTFGDQLALVQLPGCFSEKGCALQRVMMAVWREQPEFFAELAHMLHSGAVKPTEADVRQLLSDQFGAAELQTWLSKHAGWAQEQLDMAQAIRLENKKIVNSTRFPQLILGDYIETGSNGNPGHYYELVRQHFGLTRTNVPKISHYPASLDLGAMVAGAPHQFEFEISNPGTIPVHVKKIQLPVGMRLTSTQPQTLAPKEHLPLKVSLIAPPAPGDFQLEIVVNSDAEPSSLKIPVQATVAKPYRIDPVLLNFKEFAEADLVQKAALTFDVPVEVGQPTANSPEFGLRLVELEAGKRYEIHVKARPNPAKAGGRMAVISVPVKPVEAGMPWPSHLQLRARGRVAAAASPNLPGTSGTTSPQP